MTDTHRYHLQTGPGADDITTVDVGQLPVEPSTLADWLDCLRDLLQRADIRISGLQHGSTRLIPEATGCRVGLERAPRSNMDWHTTTAEAVAAARTMEAEERLPVRPEHRPDVAAHARRVISRMLSDGLEGALREQIQEAVQAMQEEILRLRKLLRGLRTRAVNLRATRHEDGYSISVVSTHAGDQEKELAERASQYLGPLLLAFNQMDADARGVPPIAPAPPPSFGRRKELSLQRPEQRLINYAANALLEGSERVPCTDGGYLTLADAEDDDAVELTYWSDYGAEAAQATFEPGKNVSMVCRDFTVLEGFSRLVHAISYPSPSLGRGRGFHDDDYHEDLADLAGPAFGDTFRLQEEGRQGYDEDFSSFRSVFLEESEADDDEYDGDDEEYDEDASEDPAAEEDDEAEEMTEPEDDDEAGSSDDDKPVDDEDEPFPFPLSGESGVQAPSDFPFDDD